MRLSVVFVALAAFMCTPPARASGYTITYRSGKLSPANGDSGIHGAKRIIVTWTISELPRGCSAYGADTLTSYTDGKNTLPSLLQKGYAYDPQDEPFLYLCVSRKGNVKQGSSFDFYLVTHDGSGNHKSYDAHHGDDEGGNAEVSIIIHQRSKNTVKISDVSDGGKYTITN